jgi:hypothetical protein
MDRSLLLPDAKEYTAAVAADDGRNEDYIDLRGDRNDSSSDDGDGGGTEQPSVQPVLTRTSPVVGEEPRAEASNDAPANLLVVSSQEVGGGGDNGPPAAAEEGRSLDLARSAAAGGDHAPHRIIISQHILRESGDFNGGGGGVNGGGLTLEIGSPASGRMLDISNMVGIAVGALGFLLIVCGEFYM